MPSLSFAACNFNPSPCTAQWFAALDTQTLLVCFVAGERARAKYASDLLSEIGEKGIVGQPKASIPVAPVELEAGSQMLIGERRQYIVALAQKHGRVLVEDLAQSLGRSRITVRKDLDYLQSRGALQRKHGGELLPAAGALFDPSLQEKEGRYPHKKHRISAAAVGRLWMRPRFTM